MADWWRRIWRGGKGEETPGPTVPALPAPEVEERLLVAAREEGKREAIAEFARAMTSQPLPLIPTPNVPSPYGVYAFDRPINYSTPQPPTRKPGSQVTTDTLRALADGYDILRACLNHLTREVATTRFEIVPRNEKDDSDRTRARCAEAMGLFTRQGAVGGYGTPYRHFENKILEDVMVVGASAIFHERDRAANWRSCVDVDAATIRPFTDAYGWTPADDGPYASHVYEQWIYGVQVAAFGRADLAYDGLWSVSWQPYFRSPVEWLIQVVNAALYADAWNRSWLTDGDTPSDMYALPETWSASDVINWQAHWEALLSGNISARTKTKFVPGGTDKVGSNSRKDQEFNGFEMWLMRRTCAITGVSPTAIGFEGDTYKVSQEGSQTQTSQFGAGILLGYRKAQLDDILERAGYGDLEAQDASGRQDSAKERAETNKIRIESGQATINEVRQAEGADPIEGGDVLLVSGQVTTLETLTNPPPPVPVPVPVPEPGKGDPDPVPTVRVNRDVKKNAADAWRDALIGREAVAVGRVREAWDAVESDLRERLAGLQERIAEARAAGEPIGESWLLAEARYLELLTAIRGRVADLASVGQAAVEEGQRGAIGDTRDAIEGVVRQSLGPLPDGAQVDIAWNALPDTAVEALVGRASEGTPLADLFRAIAEDTPERPGLVSGLRNALVQGLAAGDNPRETARQMDAAFGIGRSRAEVIARTEILSAQREATRQSYAANADIVTSWVWWSALGIRTCAACWGMHGTEHDLSESLDGHPQCRCVMRPKTRSWAQITGDESLPEEPVDMGPTGAEAFRALTETQQRTILGDGLYELYAAGTISLPDAVTRDVDDRWGAMHRPATIAEATAQAAARAN